MSGGGRCKMRSICLLSITLLMGCGGGNDPVGDSDSNDSGVGGGGIAPTDPIQTSAVWDAGNWGEVNWQ